MTTLESDTWNQLHPQWNQRNRHSLVRMITLERSTLRVVGDEMVMSKMLGLTLNVSNGGLCLLAAWSPMIGEIFRVHLPLSNVGAMTPTLVDVRWVRHLPFEGSGFSMVGLKFIV